MYLNVDTYVYTIYSVLKMKIAFIENQLSIRGTTIAMYDYAHFNETILQNTSIIISRPYEVVKNHVDNDKSIYDKFEARFKVRYYHQPSDITQICQEEGVDCAYIIKAGDPGVLHSFGNTRLFVHAVFEPRHPHGHFYAVISEHINNKFGTTCSVLPHIIDLPSTTTEDGHKFRDTLGIPHDAVVYGRIGGYDAFNIKAAQQAVDQFSQQHPDVYFLMVHTEPFCTPRKNVIHLDKITDPQAKAIFIEACDAMMYGRTDGETFGIAIGEFSIKNKPIFATCQCDENPKMDLMHQLILKDRAMWYTTKESLLTLLTAFTKERRDETKTEDWNCYRAYEPQNVMKLFDTYIKQMMNSPTPIWTQGQLK